MASTFGDFEEFPFTQKHVFDPATPKVSHDIGV
jgi:hypothetical protein